LRSGETRASSGRRPLLLIERNRLNAAEMTGVDARTKYRDDEHAWRIVSETRNPAVSSRSKTRVSSSTKTKTWSRSAASVSITLCDSREGAATAPGRFRPRRLRRPTPSRWRRR
jgi:hypothetical protein